MQNIDSKVAQGFGHEWARYSQTEADLSSEERAAVFDSYFQGFPWDRLPPNAVGLDAGCGSGRWAMMVAPRVGHLHVLDASEQALDVARVNLKSFDSVTFHLASVGDIPLPDKSLDFAFSLGVLHHVPDTIAALRSISAKLKPGAPFLVYLYYALDNRPWWFRGIWRMTEFGRRIISALPYWLKPIVSFSIAALVYWPLARLSTLLDRVGSASPSLPLFAYRDRSFYTMRTDAYDRFCTRLEKRFTRSQITDMLTGSGFTEITFSDTEPFWCAIAQKA
jgi:ubiquinone/menaquinone biosynthesis C-methylase UbiE